MSMSTHIVGFKPADDKFKRMLKVWQTCVEAGVSPPKEVDDFFGGEKPDPTGVEIHFYDYKTSKWIDGIKKWSADMSEGLEVDLRKLDPDIKILRFINSY